MRLVACLIALGLSGQFIAKDRLTGTATTPTGTPLSCADATTRCVPSEYATIQACNNAANAGDVCWITAGTYVESVTFNHSGTSGNPVTYLASGTVTFCGGTFSSQSYIRFVGVTVDRSTVGCSAGHGFDGSGTNTGLEFWDVNVQNGSGNKAYSFDIGLGTRRCDKCIFIGGNIHNFGNPSSTVAMQINGDDNFVGYIDFATICYVGIGPVGARGRFVNNNFSGLVACAGSHPDAFYIASNSTIGWTNSVVESSFDIGTPSSNQNKFHHQQNESSLTWSDNVYRFNVGTDIGSGVYSVYATSSGSILRTFWYNNTWVLNDRATSSPACGSGRADNSTTVSLTFLNELYYECWDAGSSTSIDAFLGGGGTGTLSVSKDYNLGYDPNGSVSFTASWTAQAHEQSNVNPSLTNVAGLDFTLQSGSGARGVGGPLTTAASCSGTTLNVASGTGGMFFGSNATNLTQYGGYLVPGDQVTVNGTTYTVSSRSTDALTLSASITCVAGDSVYLGTSSTIDIGAYPYKAGGYTLSATKAQVGSTVTITPNDATLARFAVVYENGIPKCVASAGNSWACSVGSGVVTAYIYPRYASQTQRVLVN